MKSKLLRLLTFVCFFQFSGINNGYAVLATVSPLNVGESASCLSRTLTDLNSTVRPLSPATFLEAGREYVVAFTLRSQNTVRDIFRIEPAAPAEKGGEGSRTGYRGSFDSRQVLSLNKKESYLKMERKSWSRDDLGGVSAAGMARTFETALPEMAVRMDRSGERFGLAWKRTLSRRFGGPLNGESAQIYITRSRI